MIHGSNTPKNERDEAATPPFIFKYLHTIYNFDIDLAATHGTNKCARYFTKDGLYYDHGPGNDNRITEIDAQIKGALGFVRWHRVAKRGFLNPPYSDLPTWINNAIEEGLQGFNTVFVIPAPNGESHYKMVEEYANRLTLVHGRLGFIRPDGTIMTGNPRGSCFVEFGPALHIWSGHDAGRLHHCKRCRILITEAKSEICQRGLYLDWVDRDVLEREYK